MKLLKISIGLLILVVVIVAVRNKIQLDRCIKKVRHFEAKISSAKHTAQQIQEAVIGSHTISLKKIGDTIQFLNLEKVFPKDVNEKFVANQPRLLFVFSELSCNVCQDEETQFGIKFASEYGSEYVMAIIHATNRQYVNNYIRMNQVNFPIFFCKDESFLEINDIRNTPMIFIIDKRKRVIAAHFPIPGHLEYSEPIHRFCYDYFNKVK